MQEGRWQMAVGLGRSLTHAPGAGQSHPCGPRLGLA